MFIAKDLFPPVTFTTSELYELATALNHPTLVKYLRHLAIQNIQAICEGSRKEGESAESYLERQAVVQGGLATVQALLKVEMPVEADKS